MDAWPWRSETCFYLGRSDAQSGATIEKRTAGFRASDRLGAIPFNRTRLAFLLPLPECRRLGDPRKINWRRSASVTAASGAHDAAEHHQPAPQNAQTPWFWYQNPGHKRIIATSSRDGNLIERTQIADLNPLWS